MSMALQNSSIWNMQTFLGGIYHIPDYQREYSWEEDEIGDFWADLESTRNDPDKQIHFFGQVVVHSDEEDNKKYIIDGQQRTITSVIFLRALQLCYEKIYSESKNDDANDRFSDIRSLYIGRNTKASPLHLVLNALDADYFREHIQLGTPEPKAKEKKKSHDRLRKAFVFFAAKLEKVLSEYKPEDVEEKIECLDDYYNAFTQRFNLLYMEATKLEEAFVIFETLNARGKDLETSDLLTNYIFSQSKDVSLSQKRWNSMVSTLDKADPTRYIRHYWNSCHDFARDKELYRTISKEVATPKSSKELLNTLEKLAPYYHAMSFPGDDVAFQDSKLISTLKALKVLKAKSFYPVILAMKQADADFSESLPGRMCTDIVLDADCFRSLFKSLPVCIRCNHISFVSTSQLHEYWIPVVIGCNIAPRLFDVLTDPSFDRIVDKRIRHFIRLIFYNFHDFVSEIASCRIEEVLPCEIKSVANSTRHIDSKSKSKIVCPHLVFCEPIQQFLYVFDLVRIDLRLFAFLLIANSLLGKLDNIVMNTGIHGCLFDLFPAGTGFSECNKRLFGTDIFWIIKSCLSRRLL